MIISWWNAGVRLGMFAVVAVLAAQVRVQDQRARAPRAAGGEVVVEPRTFFQQLEAEIARVGAEGAAVTLVYVDAAPPGAGEVRDDELFSEGIAQVLRRTLRGSDVVARPRGHEFAVLLPDTDTQAAAAALQRLRKALEGHRRLHGRGAPALSVGAVTCASPSARANEVVQRAFQLMYMGTRADQGVALAHETFASTPSASAAT